MKKTIVICMAIAAVAVVSCCEKKDGQKCGEKNDSVCENVDKKDSLNTDSISKDSTKINLSDDITENQGDKPDVTAIPQMSVTGNGKSPLPELRQASTQYAKQLEKAKSMDEVLALGEEMAKMITVLQNKYPDYEPTPEEAAESEELINRNHEAAIKAAQRFAPEVKQKMTK